MNTGDARATLTTVILGVLTERLDVVMALDALGSDTVECLTRALVTGVITSSVCAACEEHPSVARVCATCNAGCVAGTTLHNEALFACLAGTVDGIIHMPFGCTEWRAKP